MTEMVRAGLGVEAVLEARDVTVRYGGLTALEDVAIAVPAGTIVGLLGPNGAGKSTLLGVISGDVRAQQGAVSLAGADVSGSVQQERVRRGLARTFQHPEIYGELTVEQHFILAYRMRTAPSRLWSDPLTGRFLRQSAEEAEEIGSLLTALGLEEVARTPLVNLSLGVSRLVEIGRALATRPKVVLLDEPSSGLDSEESKLLAAVLRRIVTERGISFLLVEHDVEMVFGLSSWVYVLDFGRLIAQGTPQQVQSDARVRSAYLGEPATAQSDQAAHRSVAAEAVRKVPRPERDVLLEVAGLRVKYGNATAIDDLALTARQGSVTALLGSNGAGKSTLARVLSGLVPPASGSITFDGTNIAGFGASRIHGLGLAYLPEGRGVFPTLTVSDNLRVAVHRLPGSERSDAIDRVIALFPVLGERQKQLAGTLSGGQQQMLSLARVLAGKPKLLIADEISLGLAPRVVDDVFEGLVRAIDDGVSVILIEQFVHRALELADTCYIMRRGRLVWSGAAASAGSEVLDHYLGAEMDASATEDNPELAPLS